MEEWVEYGGRVCLYYVSQYLHESGRVSQRRGRDEVKRSCLESRTICTMMVALSLKEMLWMEGGREGRRKGGDDIKNEQRCVGQNFARGRERRKFMKA
jgi:hypothetical protein